MIHYNFKIRLRPLDYPRISMDCNVTRTLMNDDEEDTESRETLFMARRISDWTQYTSKSVRPMLMYNMVNCELIANGLHDVEAAGAYNGCNYVIVSSAVHTNDDGDEVEVLTLRVVVFDEEKTVDEVRNFIRNVDNVPDGEDDVGYWIFTFANNNISNNILKYTYDKCCFIATIFENGYSTVSSEPLPDYQEYNCYFQYAPINPNGNKEDNETTPVEVVEEVEEKEEPVDGEITENVREEEGLPADDVSNDA